MKCGKCGIKISVFRKICKKCKIQNEINDIERNIKRTKKKYCSNCKNYVNYSDGYVEYEDCLISVKYDSYDEEKETSRPDEINKNNDCKYYKDSRPVEMTRLKKELKKCG